MLTLNDFDYSLPSSLIAQQPLAKRDHCRLLVFSRRTLTWTHHHFYDLPQILKETGHHYLIIRNNSQVIPARIFGRKPTGGHVEIFLVRRRHQTSTCQTWECLSKPRLKVGQIITFPAQNLTATCTQILDEYTILCQFSCSPTSFQQFLFQDGHTPIPPYIKSSLPETTLRQVYQTIYAQHPGSVAAPTAGLHFTASLTQKLTDLGFEFADITLHVSLGTFLGVKCDNIAAHRLHTESYTVSPASLQKIRSAVNMRQKILAVGTTATRVLESIAPQFHDLSRPSHTGETSIFLYPPRQFALTDSLITNFHLPQSTLLMLVAAFTSQPQSQEKFTTWSRSSLGRAYADAIAQKYRFFSFGDAMLIL